MELQLVEEIRAAIKRKDVQTALDKYEEYLNTIGKNRVIDNIKERHCELRHLKKLQDELKERTPEDTIKKDRNNDLPNNEKIVKALGTEDQRIFKKNILKNLHVSFKRARKTNPKLITEADQVEEGLIEHSKSQNSTSAKWKSDGWLFWIAIALSLLVWLLTKTELIIEFIIIGYLLIIGKEITIYILTQVFYFYRSKGLTTPEISGLESTGHNRFQIFLFFLCDRYAVFLASIFLPITNILLELYKNNSKYLNIRSDQEKAHPIAPFHVYYIMSTCILILLFSLILPGYGIDFTFRHQIVIVLYVICLVEVLMLHIPFWITPIAYLVFFLFRPQYRTLLILFSFLVLGLTCSITYFTVLTNISLIDIAGTFASFFMLESIYLPVFAIKIPGIIVGAVLIATLVAGLRRFAIIRNKPQFLEAILNQKTAQGKPSETLTLLKEQYPKFREDNEQKYYGVVSLAYLGTEELEQAIMAYEKYIEPIREDYEFIKKYPKKDIWLASTLCKFSIKMASCQWPQRVNLLRFTIKHKLENKYDILLIQDAMRIAALPGNLSSDKSCLSYFENELQERKFDVSEFFIDKPKDSSFKSLEDLDLQKKFEEDKNMPPFAKALISINILSVLSDVMYKGRKNPLKSLEQQWEKDWDFITNNILTFTNSVEEYLELHELYLSIFNVETIYRLQKDAELLREKICQVRLKLRQKIEDKGYPQFSIGELESEQKIVLGYLHKKFSYIKERMDENK